MQKKKITFFTPYGGYTGSEMMLWYLICCLDPLKYDITFFSLQKGELADHFPGHVKVYTSVKNKNLLYRVIDKVFLKFGLSSLETRQIMRLEKKAPSDLWYLNTIVPYEIGILAQKHSIPYAVHFHELLTQYSFFMQGSKFQSLLEHTLFAVGCSEKVCQNLSILGLKKIFKQYECVDFSQIKISKKEGNKLRSDLKIPDDHLVIAMSGQRIDRKGYDLFIETAIRLKHENLFFLWLGGEKNNGYEYFLEKLIEQNEGVKIRVLAPSRKDYYNYLNLSDVFFLSSREDPFPLVMLEAGYLGKPVMAFKSGGSEEFIKPDTGILLDNFSLETIEKGIAEMKSLLNQNFFDSATITENAGNYDSVVQSKLFEAILSDNLNS